MTNAGKSLPYDPADRQSICRYAEQLRGSTLREKTGAEEVDDIRKNKGSFGSAVESRYFMLDVNNESEADFWEAGLELKTTPLKMTRDGRLVAKERLVIGMIDYMRVVHETFETSHLMEKAKDMLLVSYVWAPDASPLDYRVVMTELVSIPNLPKGDLAQIKQDWETVVGKVRSGRAHEISGSDTLYLEACTKAANAQVRRPQPFSAIEAKPRAWALKASFMTAITNRLMGEMQPIGRDQDEQNMPLLQLVRKRFAPYFGLTERQLAERFGLGKPGARMPKNLCALITRRILGVTNDAKIEEFEKAGIKPKTMRVKANGTPKESMSFPCFDYFDLAKMPFEESDFAAHLDNKYLFVVFREDVSERGTYRLADVAFWQMPEVDVEEARRCYEEMQRRVRDGRAQESVKSSENRCCHVRPHGRDSKDTLPTPQGDAVVKKCFWLSAAYLKGEVARITGK